MKQAPTMRNKSVLMAQDPILSYHEVCCTNQSWTKVECPSMTARLYLQAETGSGCRPQSSWTKAC